MVSSIEVQNILERLPEDLRGIAFLSDIYQTLSAYDGDEFSGAVKKALKRIKEFIDSQTNKDISPDNITPERAVVLNDYLSIYKSNELNATQLSLKNNIASKLEEFDIENNLLFFSNPKINETLDDLYEKEASKKAVVYYQGDNIIVNPEYKEFESFLKSLSPNDLKQLLEVLEANAVQKMAINGGISDYVDIQKSLLREAEDQTRLTYLTTKYIETMKGSGRPIPRHEAEEYVKSEKADELLNFDYSKADKETLANTVKSVTFTKLHKANYVALRLKQKCESTQVWQKIKIIDENFSKRHPFLYKSTKILIEGGKVAAISATGGPLLLAGYSAVKVLKDYNKRIADFEDKKQEALAEGKPFPNTYKEYLKENPIERKVWRASIITTAIGAGFAGYGTFAQGAAVRAARALTTAGASLSTGVALQREQARAAEKMKEFLIKVGVPQKDISSAKLYLKPKKYCSEILKDNNIKMSASQKEEFEKKLGDIIKSRSAKRARYLGAATGALTGFWLNGVIKDTEFFKNTVKPLWNDSLEKLSGIFHRTPNPQVASDNSASPNSVAKDTTLASNGGVPKEANLPSNNDTVQSSYKTSVSREVPVSEKDPQDPPMRGGKPRTPKFGDPIPDKTVGELLEQEGNSGNVYKQEPAHTITNTNTGQDNLASNQEPKQQHSSSQRNTTVEETSSQPENKTNPIDETVLSPAEALKVTNPENNVFVTENGISVELVRNNETGEINTVFSNIPENYTNDNIDSNLQQIENNIRTAIGQKDNPTDIECQFAGGCNEDLQLQQEEPVAKPKITTDDVIDKVKPAGTVESVTQGENGHFYIKSTDVPVETAPESPSVQEQVPPTEERPDESILNQQIIDSPVRTHFIDTGYYGYDVKYSISIDNNNRLCLNITNYNPEVDYDLYTHVMETRTDATNGIQYSEVMGGTIGGHPNNIADKVNDFCVSLEQSDLAYRNLMDRQHFLNYQPTALEKAWIREYENEIASYGLAYDNGRLVPVLDQKHTMANAYGTSSERSQQYSANSRAQEFYNHSATINNNLLLAQNFNKSR